MVFGLLTARGNIVVKQDCIKMVFLGMVIPHKMASYL